MKLDLNIMNRIVLNYGATFDTDIYTHNYNTKTHLGGCLGLVVYTKQPPAQLEIMIE